MSLSTTTNILTTGFPWWAILLIVIGCIFVAIVGVFVIVYLTKKQKRQHQQEAVDFLKKEHIENIN